MWRAERKRALTAVSSSRWAGALTRAVEDQYQLGMRALGAHVGDLQSAIGVLEQRCALRPGETATEDPAASGGRRRVKRGYATAGERFSKTRRLACLRQRLAAAQADLAAGRPAVTVGGKRLWRTRHNLQAAGIDESGWRQRWDAARLFVTADGETGKNGGNETIRVDEQGQLRLKVPAALAAKYGSHLQVAAPVRFSHGGCDLAARITANQAVRYDISFDAAKGRWYLDASWAITADPPAELDQLRQGRVLGVDLNADHLAACVLDDSGNPVAQPVTIGVEVHGLRASRRDGRVRAAITALLDTAQQHGCSAIAVENLTSPMPAPPAGRRWAAASAGRPSGAPSPASPPRSSATASPRWPPAAGLRSSVSIPPTPASGAINTGVNHCSNRLRSGHPPSRRGGRHR
ncbi:hypothetical protein [Mycobacterium novum]